MNNTKSLVSSAIVRAADSAEKLRASDAWRVYDAALELGVVAEVKNALREANPAAFAAMCEYEADDIMASLRALEDNIQPGPMDEDAKTGLRAAIAKATGGAA